MNTEHFSHIKTPDQALGYVLNDKERVPELEPLILQCAVTSFYYAKQIIKGRWLEAEPNIMKHNISVDYINLFPAAASPMDKTTPLVILLRCMKEYSCVVLNDVSATITNEQLQRLLTLLYPDFLNGYNIKYLVNWRVLSEPLINQITQNTAPEVEPVLYYTTAKELPLIIPGELLFDYTSDFV